MNSNTKPLVSVIIVSRNRKKACELCLSYLYAQDYPNLEIILVDNGSMENTVNFLKAQGEKIRLYSNDTNKGACVGRNHGFKYSKGDYILFLDSDVCLIDKSTISRAIEEFARYQNLGELGGIGYFDKNLARVQHGLLIRNKYFELDPMYLKKIPYDLDFATDYVQSDFAMIKRDVFEKIGGFDSFYFYYFEDLDLSWRVKESGFLVGISPKIKFWHQYIPRRSPFDHSELVKNLYFIVKNLPLVFYFSYLFYLIRNSLLACYYSKSKLKNLFLLGWYIVGLPYFGYYLLFLTIIKVRKKINFIYINGKNGFTRISEKILRFPIEVECLIISWLGRALFWMKRKYGNRGIYLFVTNRCNLACEHCFYKSNVNKKVCELTVAEIEKIHLSLRNKIKGVTITGGEPFLRDDIVEICRIFQKNGSVSNINIITNGYMPEMIRSKFKHILENRPEGQQLMITVSLDGFERTHDQIRGVQGAYKMVIATIDLLKGLLKENNGFTIRVALTLMNLNYNEFIDFYNFVTKELGVQFTFNWFREDFVGGLSPELINYSDSRGAQCKLPSLDVCEDIHQFIQEEKWENLVLNLINQYTLETLRNKKMLFPCVAPDLNLVIYPDGGVSFCEMLKPFFNIRDFDYDLKKMLRSPRWRKAIHQINKCFCIHPCILGINMQRRNFIDLKFEQLRNFRLKEDR